MIRQEPENSSQIYYRSIGLDGFTSLIMKGRASAKACFLTVLLYLAVHCEETKAATTTTTKHGNYSRANV